MTYDEFAEKLRKVKADFRRQEGREPATVAELEAFLDSRLARPKPRAAKAARSLRGLFG